MNATTNHSLAVSHAISCDWTFDDQFVDNLFSVLSIILNLLTCPLTILLNTLVIIAVKTKPRLQNVHNIILASMAGTDLAVGIVPQPVFIAREISRQTGAWIAFDVLQSEYNNADNNNSPLHNFSFSFDTNFHRTLNSNEIFLEI